MVRVVPGRVVPDNYKSYFYDPAKEKKKQDTSIIPWKDAKILRRDSPRPTINDMARALEHEGIIQVNTIGSSFSGKSELNRFFAHELHKEMERRGYKFTVVDYRGKDLLKIDEIAESLSGPTIALFHDVAYLEADASPVEFKKFMQHLFKIRHKTGRIALFLNYHYTRAAVPALRGSTDWTFYTTMSLVDKQRIEGDLGQISSSLFHWFYRESQQIKTRQTWRVRSPKMVYRRRKPFIVSLLYYGGRFKIQATPLRQWIDKHCHICDNAQKGVKKSYIENQEDIFAKLAEKYKRGNMQIAIRQLASEMGYETYGYNVSKLKKDIREIAKNASIDWKALCEQFGVMIHSAPDGETQPEKKRRLKERKTDIKVPEPIIKQDKKDGKKSGKRNKNPPDAGRANFHAPKPKNNKNGTSGKDGKNGGEP